MFSDQLNKIISDYNRNYFSFRIQIKSDIKIKESINEENLSSIIKYSANNYFALMNSNKISLLFDEQKEKYKFSKSILKETNTSIVINSFNDLLDKYMTQFKNQKEISNNCFLILFLIQYLAVNYDLSQREIGEVEPYLGSNGSQCIFDFIKNFYNKNNKIPKSTSHSILYKITNKVQKDILINIPRVPFYNHLTTLPISNQNHKFIKDFFNNFYRDIQTTVKDWPRGIIVYDNKYISRHLNGKYIPNISLKDIGKNIAIKSNIKEDNFDTKILRSHIELATKCENNQFIDFMLATFNQNNLISLGHVIVGKMLFEHEIKYNLQNHYIYVNKISNNLFDIMVALSFDSCIHTNNLNKNIKFKNPINWAYVFSLNIDESQKLIIKNFNIGFVNLKQECQYTKILK